MRRLVVALVLVDLIVGVGVASTRHAAGPQRVTSAARAPGPSSKSASASGSASATTASTDSTVASDPTMPAADSGATASAVDGSSSSADGPGPGASPTTTTAPEPTTTPPGPSCHNSHDSACGPLVWSPSPQAATTPTEQITVTPAHPHPGDLVTFHVVVHDDHAPVFAGNPCYGDTGCLVRTDGAPANDVGYGPWSPPVVRPTTYDDGTHFTHTYQNAGEYTMRVTVQAISYLYGDDCPGDPSLAPYDDQYPCVDPYAYFGYATVTIDVT
jgi:hypothetical protein